MRGAPPFCGGRDDRCLAKAKSHLSNDDEELKIDVQAAQQAHLIRAEVKNALRAVKADRGGFERRGLGPQFDRGALSKREEQV